MKEKMIEIREFTSPGYQPVFDFDSWRVAVLNYLDEIHPERIDFMERHNKTDEVFVLTQGNGILFVGEGDVQIVKIIPQVMESGKIYNVKRSTWHTIVLSRKGSVLIVENSNTGKENSDYISLDLAQRRVIIETARRELIDWK